MVLESLCRRRFSWILLTILSALLGDAPIAGNARDVSFTQAPGSPISVGGVPSKPAIADINGDGWADIVVVLENAHAIEVLLGRPQGGFQPAPGSPFAAGNSPTFLAVSELDGDAHLDVVVVNSSDNTLTFLHGDGRGGFHRSENPISTGLDPQILRIGDVNGDSRMDLLVANRGSQSISILLGQGNGSFVPSLDSPFPLGARPTGLAVADFNGDGRADIATISFDGNAPLSVLLGQSTGRVVATTVPSEPGSYVGLLAADLDRDGNMDLVSSLGGSQGSIIFLKGDGTGAFQTRTWSTSTELFFNSTSHLFLADFTADGFPDIALVNSHFNGHWNWALGLALNDRKGSFGKAVQYLPFRIGPFNSYGSGDMNGDGALDLVICSPEEGLTVLLNRELPPALEVTPIPAVESDLVAKIQLRRNGLLDQRISFVVATADATAKAGREYTALRTRVVFEPGQRDRIVNVPLLNDDFGSHEGRQFLLEFSDGDGVVGLPWPVSVQIRDDDELVTLVAEVQGAGLQKIPDTGQFEWLEGKGPVRFIARRSGSVNSTRRFQVHYRVEGRATTRDDFGTEAAAAVLGVDYAVAAPEGVLEFGPGMTEQSVEVNLVNDYVPHGFRGIAFHLSYEGIVNQGGDERVILIHDDERLVLRQQVALDPYVPFEHTGIRSLHELPDGKVLVFFENELLRLTRDGLPDLSFGLGTGRTVLPLNLSENDTISLDSILADGRLQFWVSSGHLIRLSEGGSPDASFFNGTSVMPFVGPLFDTAADGSMIVASADGSTLAQLLPNGLPDPGFLSAWPYEQGVRWAEVTPRGQIWAVSWAGDLVRFSANGELDTGFAARKGLEPLLNGWLDPSKERAHSDLDREGRAYFRVADSQQFGDLTEGAIVRFLTDGRYDETYRPWFDSTVSVVMSLDPDGTVLARVNGRELVEVDPTGRARTIQNSARSINRAKRLSAGTYFLSSFVCSHFGLMGEISCSETDFRILAADGTQERLGGGFFAQSNRRFGPWYWSTGDSLGVLNRMDTKAGSSRIGLAHSGRHALASSASVVIQRAGITANAARVRGRVFPLVDGRWDEGEAQPFEVEFAVGQSEIEWVLPHQTQPGRQSLAEYLVRLETSVGVEISDFSACRLWVLDDTAMPGVGSLLLKRLGGGDEQNRALLYGMKVDGKSYYSQFRSRFDLPWLFDSTAYAPMGAGWVRTIPTDRTPTGFFRMITE